MSLTGYFPSIADGFTQDVRTTGRLPRFTIDAQAPAVPPPAQLPRFAAKTPVASPAFQMPGPLLTALLGTALPPQLAVLGGVAERMFSSGGELPPEKKAPLPAAVAKAAAAVEAPPEITLDDMRTSALKAVLSNPKGVSLRQLMAITQAAPAPRKPFSIKDIAGGDALEAARQALATGLKAAGENIPEQQKAYTRYQTAAAALAGVDLQNEQLAALLAAEREKE
jgi:hypothetical protein